MLRSREMTTTIIITTTNQYNTNLIRPQCRMLEDGHSWNCRHVEHAPFVLISNCFPGSHYVRSLSDMASLWFKGKITCILV
jgi:hypothetical protein